MRKMFLVAECLSWEDAITSMYDKSTNEELNWAVNYDLGILDPFVEDPEQVPGGKNSQTNKFYPYANEYEMQLAFGYISITENITESTWALWIGRHLDLQRAIGSSDLDRRPKIPSLKEDGLKLFEKRSSLQKTPDIEIIDLTGSPPKPKTKIPPLLSGPYMDQASVVSLPTPQGPRPYFNKHRRIVSYKSLQDFYELLDKIERTSYVGAMFLEAYAEKLRDDLCKDCWFKRNVNLDLY
ncbi:hypothetical protein E8E13_007408 [Curvularia kusanoi]|uniref:Uncharacterized protein n=1 Tax=Curvularia kusanoi TaxID=90978 RepID=A0A9P4TJX8_CURKU|nr:hypothetical protein E8E13_007408 [Curvularia kusanoi]